MEEMKEVLATILLPIDPNADDGARGAIYFFRAFLFFAIFAFIALTLNAIRVLL